MSTPTSPPNGKHDAPPLTDGITVIEALRAFPFPKKTLYRVCEQDAPFLGRPIHHEHQGPRRVLRISRGDLAAYLDIFEKPLHRPLPGNTGVWIADGVYEEGGTIWYTAKYLQAHKGIHHFLPGHWIEHRCPALDPSINGGRLRCQLVLWPFRKRPHDSQVRVFHGDDVKAILRRRAPGGASPDEGEASRAGKWLDAGTYQDAAGPWLTSRRVQETYDVSDMFVHFWKYRPHPALDPAGGGVLRRQYLFRPFAGKGGRRLYVYHQEDIDRMATWARQQMPASTRAPGPDWETGRQLARRLGLAGPEGRVALGTLLRIGREVTAFPAFRVRTERGKSKWAGWRYPAEAVLRALAGRDVVALSAEWRKDLDQAAAVEATPNQPGNAGPAAADSGQQAHEVADARTAKAGRPFSAQTTDLYQFCFDGYNRGEKLAVTRERAAKQFGARAPKEDRHVTEYARRYAKRTGQRIKRQTAQKTLEKQGPQNSTE
jgi:hypothetical protein